MIDTKHNVGHVTLKMELDHNAQFWIGRTSTFGFLAFSSLRFLKTFYTQQIRSEEEKSLYESVWVGSMILQHIVWCDVYNVVKLNYKSEHPYAAHFSQAWWHEGCCVYTLVTSSRLFGSWDPGVITWWGSPDVTIAWCHLWGHMETRHTWSWPQPGAQNTGQDAKLFKVHQSFSTVKFLAQIQSLLGTCHQEDRTLWSQASKWEQRMLTILFVGKGYYFSRKSYNLLTGKQNRLNTC